MSPMERSLAVMRERGYHCEKVEYWESFSKRRKDLLGFADILCLRGSETCVVQTTSASHVSERVKKITEHPNVGFVREAGWRILVHGWNGDKLREVDLS